MPTEHDLNQIGFPAVKIIILSVFYNMFGILWQKIASVINFFFFFWQNKYHSELFIEWRYSENCSETTKKKKKLYKFNIWIIFFLPLFWFEIKKKKITTSTNGLSLLADINYKSPSVSNLPTSHPQQRSTDELSSFFPLKLLSNHFLESVYQ